MGCCGSAQPKPSTSTGPVAAASTPSRRNRDAPAQPPAEPHYKLDLILRSMELALPRERAAKRREGHAGSLMESRAVVTFKVLLTGPASAGKTHLLYSLIGGPGQPEPAETDIEPNVETVYVTRGSDDEPRVNFLVADLGGRPDIRARDFAGAAKNCTGVVFAVDASAAETLDDAKAWLKEVATSQAVASCPVLLIAHKSDKQGALPAPEIAKRLGLAEIADPDKALAVATSLTDDGLTACAAGLQWLAGAMQRDGCAGETSPPRARAA
eukprot:TRINITY_DN35514_c0_g1_i1.p1 TRINITY_DN35514_c0_g1~~TRINITY_DN35514_c0_g1_i1.p1  ORF type:complete len:298 (+),score=57.23 TRINITY_DN35514_c0_g1_i1:88-894(+)